MHDDRPRARAQGPGGSAAQERGVPGGQPPGQARDLRPLFDPASVAVVGASADTSKWGGDAAARLVSHEARRRVYLVNRRGGVIHGCQAYPSLSDLPEAPELVILAMPAEAFESIVDEALVAGSRAFVAIFAGLGEAGPEGRARERAVAERVRAAGAVMIGPNCMGLTDHSTGLQAVAFLDVPAGDIGFISQSGAMGEEMVMRARAWGCGFSRYVTLGNQADLGIAEVLAGFAAHEATRVVAVYAEELRDGRPFAAAAARVVGAGKPVVLLAPGRSAAGARGARSHTGSLTPDTVVLDAVCRVAGIVRAETPRELFELTAGLRGAPAARGRRVAVITEGGGHGSVAADMLGAAGLAVPRFSDALVARVRETLPASAGDNPIDFAIGTTEPDTYGRVLPALASADEIDAVLAVGQLGYWAARFPEFDVQVAAEMQSAAAMSVAALSHAMPLVVSTVYAESAPAARLRADGIPVYREIASAVNLLAALAHSAETSPAGVPELPATEAPLTGEPGYWEARTALAGAGLSFVPAQRVSTVDEALAAAREIGFPVALKALGLLHKSDSGGVALALADAAALTAAYDQMRQQLDPPGFVVEGMAAVSDGVELIAGCRRDPVFGPLLVVGLGGLYVELLSDVRAALAPVTAREAQALINELQGAPLLAGARGRPPLDNAAAAQAVAALSRFAAAHPEISEVEVNPLLVLPRGAVALDARVVMRAPSHVMRAPSDIPG